MTDFSQFISESDLSAEEERSVEISRPAYLNFCRNINDSVSELSDNKSEIDEEDWAAVDNLSSGWLVGCFGLNGPLRQYFSLYQAVSQRKGEREREMTDESKKCPNNPHPHPLQAQ